MLLAFGVLALLFARGEGNRFHLPFGDGTIIAAAGIWAAALIVVPFRPLLWAGSAGAGVRCAAVPHRRARASQRPPDDLPGEERPAPAHAARATAAGAAGRGTGSRVRHRGRGRRSCRDRAAAAAARVRAVPARGRGAAASGAGRRGGRDRRNPAIAAYDRGGAPERGGATARPAAAAVGPIRLVEPGPASTTARGSARRASCPGASRGKDCNSGGKLSLEHARVSDSQVYSIGRFINRTGEHLAFNGYRSAHMTFAALVDPTRRSILARLSEGEATVSELADKP